MGVKGLTGLLAQYPESYKPMMLHNTNLVIDLCNFVNLIYVDLELQSQYSGEYLSYRLALERIFENFKECKIEPIFILDGCHEPDFNKAGELIKRRLRTIGELENVKAKSLVLPADDASLNINQLPKQCLDVLVCIIKKFGFKSLVLDYESDPETSAIAAALGCPVVSGDSDFYIFNHSIETTSDDGYRFIPMSEFSRNLQVTTEMGTSCRCATRCVRPRGLQVRYFCKSTSPLADIPESYLPLLALMAGNDTLDSKLPRHVMAAMNNYRNICGKNFGYAIRKLLAVKGWLKPHVGSPHSILKEFMQCQQLPEHELLRIMNYGLRQYFLPTHLIARRILPKLGLNVPDLQLKPFTAVSGSDISLNAILKFLQAGFPDVYDHFGLTEGWSTNLKGMYANSELNPNYLDTLYTNVGLLIRPAYEDICEKSFSHVAIPFRRIFYGILMDLEAKPQKLIGLKRGKVVEYFRDETTINRGMLAVEKIPMRREKFSFLQLLQTYAAMPYRCEALDANSPAWLNGLICMLAYQMVGSSVDKTKYDPEKINSIFLICAISAHLKMLQEFHEAAHQLMREFRSLNKLDFSINMVINELGLVYQMMKILHRLCHLFGQPDTAIDFEDPTLVIPSGRLLHCLYAQQRIDPKTVLQKLLGTASLVRIAQTHFTDAQQKVQELRRLLKPTKRYDSVSVNAVYHEDYYEY